MKLAIRLFRQSDAVLKVGETARALRVSEERVRELIEEGLLLAMTINDARTPKRRHYRLQRFSVEAWWLHREEMQHGRLLDYEMSRETKYWLDELRQRSKRKVLVKG